MGRKESNQTNKQTNKTASISSKDIQYADYKNVNLLDKFNVFFLYPKHSNFLFSN